MKKSNISFEHTMTYLTNSSTLKKEMSVICEEKSGVINSEGRFITLVEVYPNTYFTFNLGGIEYTIFERSNIQMRKSPRGIFFNIRQKLNNITIFIKE